MLGAVKYNLTHLLDFSGRDARQTFWFYVLFVFLVNIAVGMIVTVAMIGRMMGPLIDAAQASASEEVIRAQMGAGMGAMMGSVMWYSLAATVVMILLLAASFVRRLHDSNRSGWWGLLVLAAQAAGIFVSFKMIGVMQEIMTAAMSGPTPMTPVEMQALMQGHNINAYAGVGWLAPLIVIVFGVMDSTEGPNRYGAEPVRF